MIIRKQDIMEALMDAFYAYSIVNEDSMKEVTSLGWQSCVLLIHLNQMNQPRTPSQLMDYFLVKPAAMSNLITRLVKQGYVERLTTPNSGKQRWIVLTPDGGQLASQLEAKVHHSTSAMVDVFNLKQQYFLQTLVRIYIRFVRGHVLEFQEADWTPLDTFVYYYYQLYFGIEWAMQTKNRVPVSFKESRIIRAVFVLEPQQTNTIRSIATYLHLSISETSELITRMSDRDIVQKRQNEKDQRLTFVYLTDETAEVVSTFVQKQSQWVDDRVTKPKIKELIQFFVVINKFTNYYKQYWKKKALP